ncbi:MAG: hypothetical protein Q7S95_00475 [bacterium]|nr:hypothetical protein [bacterium]
MEIAGLGADNILKLLDGLIEGDTKLPDEAIGAMLVELYTELTGSYTPFVRALPALAEPISKDLAPAIGALLGIAGNVANDEAVQAAQRNLAKAKATNRMASYKAYQDAGFSKKEAFQLLMIDAAGQRSFPKAFAEGLKSANTSTSKETDE